MIYLKQDDCKLLLKNPNKFGPLLIYEEKEYLLLNQAEIDCKEFGTRWDYYYSANGVLVQDLINITEGNTQSTDEGKYKLDTYTVCWDIFEKYLREDGRLHTFESAENDENADWYEDESLACDWNNPSEICIDE
ncbi:hypothetical protein MKZ01_13975 [Lysinibacillus endophyticus]|uniref:hypothetical protein n=1 Tax=Ureibacillus endophyticus TaxID=1978490 RepID=UPI003136C197